MESFVKFGPANQESIGDICMVSNCLFSVSSYILVLRLRYAPRPKGTDFLTSEVLFIKSMIVGNVWSGYQNDVVDKVTNSFMPSIEKVDTLV